jgi:hypothetical protein
MPSNNLLLTAALSHYQAQHDEALATLVLYLNNSVGIGDHSDILKEITKWTQTLTEADDNIATLNQYFLSNQTQTEETE